MSKNDGWKTIFPKQGHWLHLHNLMSAGLIIQWVDENYKDTKIKVCAYPGSGDNGGMKPKKWRLTTRAQIATFSDWLIDNTGTNKNLIFVGKVRVEAKRRHHDRP